MDKIIYFFISILLDMEKEWDNYKMEIVISKDRRSLLKKLIRKKIN